MALAIIYLLSGLSGLQKANIPEQGPFWLPSPMRESCEAGLASGFDRRLLELGDRFNGRTKLVHSWIRVAEYPGYHPRFVLETAFPVGSGFFLLQAPDQRLKGFAVSAKCRSRVACKSSISGTVISFLPK